MEYPQEIVYKDGNKVAFLYYATKQDALQASKIAIQKASYKASQGYDFGFNIPGTISKVGKYFEVIIP